MIDRLRTHILDFQDEFLQELSRFTGISCLDKGIS